MADRSSGTAMFVIALTSILHLAWAVLLLSSAAVGNATPVYGVIRITGSREGAIIALAATAVLAMFISWIERSPRHSAVMPYFLAGALVPQQFFLLISALSGISAVIAGHYADGTVRPWQFILGDQLPVILLAVSYTSAIIIVGRGSAAMDVRKWENAP